MFETDLAQVTAALVDAADIGGLLGEATTYHLASGGKAWRARLAIECSQALGVPPQDMVGLAVACELVHQASVVHDDVQDAAHLRRGRESVTSKFGPATALCVGDHLLVSAFAQLASLPGSPALIRLFAAGISEMAAAQTEEFGPVLWAAMTWSRYEALAAGKSGAMIVLPVVGAALLAGLPATDIEPLSRAARNLGVACQAGDDIEDLGADLAVGALNGVIARALDTAGDTQRARWLDLLARARLHRLSQAEIRCSVASLQQEAVVTKDWVSALLSRSALALHGRTSPRCRGLVAVIERAAGTLSGNLASHGESRHAA